MEFVIITVTKIMKQIFVYNIIILLFLSLTNLFPADGFRSETLVHTSKGLMSINQCKVGDYVFNNYDSYVYPIYHIFSYYSSCCIKITIADEFICVSPHQRLYCVNQDDWICARNLKIADQLLCRNNKIISVDDLEIIKQPQKMYTISIKTNHIFCVGNHGILAHNIEPISSTVGIIAISGFFPPAAAAVAIGEVIVFGVAGLFMYCMHKKMEKNKQKQQGCFSEKNEYLEQGCPAPEQPIEIIACGIPIAQEKITEIIPYVKSEDIIVGCEFPIEVIPETNIQLHDIQKDDSKEKEQYNGPWYNRTEDWIEQHPFGQKIKKSLERSQYTNQGKRAFQVVKKIENCDGFNKGDFIVVDAMHKDHFEVFGKNKEWSHVANFDGTKNIEKTKQGMKERRAPLKR